MAIKLTATFDDQATPKLTQLTNRLDGLAKVGGASLRQVSQAAQQTLGTLEKLGGSSGSLIDRLAAPLQRLAQSGLEPLARVSPTAAHAIQGLLTQLGPVGLVAGAATGGFVALGAALTSAVTSAANTADALGKLSIKTGIGVEALSSLKVAAELSDVSLEEVSVGIRQMANSLDAAAQGSAAQVEALARLGVSLETIRSQAPEQQFETLARAIQGVRDPTTRAALAMDVFGRAGTQLLPLLEDIAQRGMAGLTDEARRLGVLITGETAKAAQEFNDNLTRLKLTAQGLTHEIGAALLPGLVALTQGAIDATQAVKALAGSQAGLQERLLAISTLAETFVPTWSIVVDTMRTAASDAIPKATVGLQALGVSASEAERLIAAFGTRSAEAVAPVAKLREQIAKLQDTLAQGVQAAGQNLAAALAEASGSALQVLEANHQKALADIERVREARAKAIEDAKLQGAQLAAALTAADEEAATNRLAVETRFQSDRTKLFASAATDAQKAATARVLAETKASGDVLAVIEAERQLAVDLIDQERDAKLRAIQSLGSATAEAEAARVAIVQEALDRTVIAEQESAAKRAAVAQAAAKQQAVAEAAVAAAAASRQKAELDAIKARGAALQALGAVFSGLQSSEEALAQLRQEGAADAADAEAQLLAARLKASGDAEGAERVLISARIEGAERALKLEQSRAASSIRALQDEIRLLEVRASLETDSTARLTIEAQIAELKTLVAIEEERIAQATAATNVEIEQQRHLWEEVGQAAQQAGTVTIDMQGRVLDATRAVASAADVALDGFRAGTAALNALAAQANAAGVTILGTLQALKAQAIGIREQIESLQRSDPDRDPRVQREARALEALQRQLAQTADDPALAAHRQQLEALIFQRQRQLEAARAEVAEERRVNELLRQRRTLYEELLRLRREITAQQQALLTSQGFGGTNLPPFQAGGVVPGPAGRPVPIIAHAGELVIPEHLVRALVQRRGDPGGRFQAGGVVTLPRASTASQPSVNVTINMQGTHFLDTDRRLYELGDYVTYVVLDRLRRGI